MPIDRELNRRLAAILAQRGVSAHRPGPSGKHRQPDRWNQVLRWVCAGSLLTIGAVIVATVGWWAAFLTALALAVGLIGISVDS